MADATEQAFRTNGVRTKVATPAAPRPQRSLAQARPNPHAATVAYQVFQPRTPRSTTAGDDTRCIVPDKGPISTQVDGGDPAIVSAPNHAELAVFIAVAEERSFRKAATRLRLTPSTLSHSLRALEDRLGVRLLNRTTRTVALTEAGAALLSEVGPAFRAVAAALEGVNSFRDRPRGTLRIHVPRLASSLLIAPKIGAFCASYPDVTLDVATSDDLVDIVKEGYDAGIRLEESLHRDMVAVRLGSGLRGAVVGSPAYFESRGMPTHPEELVHHLCINRRHIVSGAMHKWEFSDGVQRLNLLASGPVVSNSDELMKQAALQGVGLAFLAEADVQEEVAAGRLIRVLMAWCPPLFNFCLYHPHNRNPSSSLKALISVLAD